MNADLYKFLYDIQDSISIIESHLSTVSNLDAYKNELKTIDAVERRLAIVGEALWKVNKLDSNINISNKSKIIGLRHILVHDYDLIDNDTIWTICKKYLPVLKEEIKILLPNN